MMLLAGCTAGRTIRMEQVRNFAPDRPQQLLFLDLLITREGAAGPEMVQIINAVAAEGLCRECGQAAFHGGYRLLCTYQYSDGRPPVTETYEHPLLRTVELFDPDGSLDRRPVSAREGHLSLRIQYDRSLTRVELFSQTPDRGPHRIHSIRIKP